MTSHPTPFAHPLAVHSHIAMDATGHHLLRIAHHGTVLRRPHPTQPHAWTVTVDGSCPTTDIALGWLTAFTAAGWVKWMPVGVAWIDARTQRADTTLRGKQALWRADVELGIHDAHCVTHHPHATP